MFAANEEKVANPIYQLLVYLNEHKSEQLETDKNLEFLLKNIRTHFRKLVYTISFMSKIQTNESFIKEYDGTKVVSIQQIEYCFYKISTIWDISYQIASKLIFEKPDGLKRPRGINKYQHLSEQFKNYSDHLPNLETNWYENFGKIRDRITHGGINIVPFYVNDDIVKNKICFQAYDLDLNDLIQKNSHYSNIYNNGINFADKFFTYFTNLLYSYLVDFFKFTLLELSKQDEINISNLALSEDPLEFFKKSHENWILCDTLEFLNITEELILLNHAKGNLHIINNMSEISKQSIIQHALQGFPFSMALQISQQG